MTIIRALIPLMRVILSEGLPAQREMGLIPGSGRFSGEGNGNQFQYSCLEIPVDRGDWWATVDGVAKS